jgi:hypothetical protein
MPLPFPKLHIAESVLNRIQNALEDVGPMGIVVPVAPVVPNPEPVGLMIDEQVSQPAPAPVPPQGLEQQTNQMAEASSFTGGSPFDGALLGGMGI